MKREDLTIYEHEGILRGMDYEDAVIILKNCNPERGDPWEQMKKELRHWCMEGIDEMMAELDAHRAGVEFLANPDQRDDLENHPDYPPDIVEEIVSKVCDLLKRWDAATDVYIYYNGKRLCVANGKIEDGLDPRDYFEYVADPHILSMTFEGEMYELLNYAVDGWGAKFANELDAILDSYGLYYEQGHAWNLSVFKK